MNVAEQFAIYLDTVDLVDYRPSAVGGDCFVDWLPDDPDALVAVNNTAGLAGDIKEPWSSPGVQFRIRAASALAAFAKANEVWSAVHGLGEMQLPNGTWLVSAQAQSTPAPIGRDTKGRHEFTVNVLAEVRELTVHRT